MDETANDPTNAMHRIINSDLLCRALCGLAFLAVLRILLTEGMTTSNIAWLTITTVGLLLLWLVRRALKTAIKMEDVEPNV